MNKTMFSQLAQYRSGICKKATHNPEFVQPDLYPSVSTYAHVSFVSWYIWGWGTEMGQPETTMLQIFILSITFISFSSKDCFKYFLLNSWKNQVIKRFKMFKKPVTELGTEPLLNCCPCLSDHITLNVLSILQSTSHLSSLLRLTIIAR